MHFHTESIYQVDSTSLYYISLYLGWEIYDQHRNTNMNDKDHLVGQLTTKQTAWTLVLVLLLHTTKYYQVDRYHRTSLGISVSSIACTTQKTFLHYQICTSTKPIYQVDRPALVFLSTCITQQPGPALLQYQFCSSKSQPNTETTHYYMYHSCTFTESIY